MVDEVVQEIMQKVKNLEKTGLDVNYKKAANSYETKGKNFRIKLTIDPEKWLGLEFYLLDQNSKLVLTYDIDTDLYDISKPEQRVFRKDTARNIIIFLDSLINREIMIGEVKRRPAMIVPNQGGYLLITKGRLLTKGSQYKDIEKIKHKESFSPLIIYGERSEPAVPPKK